MAFKVDLTGEQKTGHGNRGGLPRSLTTRPMPNSLGAKSVESQYSFVADPCCPARDEEQTVTEGVMWSGLIEGLRKLCFNVRIVKNEHWLIPEVDLVAPLMVPKAFLIRALIDRMPPGRHLILRSNDIEMPWEIEHICNRLGHEVMDVEKEGQTFFFTIRTRGDDRLPVQDPSQLVLTPQKPTRTIDITPSRQPDELENRSPSSFISMLCRKRIGP